MANEKIISSRIQNKVDTEVNWTTAGQNGFIPKNGEFIIYKEDEAHLQRRIKIGDGTTPVHELPFVVGEDEDDTNMTKGTGEGATQQVTDDATFSIDSDYVDSLVTDKTGTKTIKTGAFGDYATELGGKSQAKGKRSVAEGTSTIALGNYSHSEGNKTFAEGSASHAEGLQSEARGNDSHAEGYLSISTGSHAHAEGYLTHAKGHGSHTEGNGTISNGQAQHVQGAWNIEDETPHTPEGYSRYAHIVGNGTAENDRSNAHTVDWQGNAWYRGEVRVGGTSYDDAKTLITAEYVDEQFKSSPITLYSVNEIIGTTAYLGSLGSVDYISNGFSCFTISKDDGMDDQTGHVGVKVVNGVIYTDADSPWAYLSDGGSGIFRVGEIDAVVGTTYKFPATSSHTTFDYGSSSYNTVYVATLDNPYNVVAIGTFVQDGEADGYLYGHCSAFNFTPTNTGKYGIYVRVEIYAHNAQNAISYDNRLLADLSSYVKPINKYATRDQVNSLDNAKVDKTSDANVVYGTDNTGAQSPIGYSVDKTPETIAKRNSDGTLSVADPIQEAHAATKKYVDDAISESGAVVPDNVVTTDNLVESLETAGFMETLGLAFEEVFTSVETKVDKTSDAYKVYGTDENGNQTTYNARQGESWGTDAIPLRTTHGNILVPENTGEGVREVDRNKCAASKKYVDDRALTDSHKSILDFIVSKIGTPNLVFGTDANGNFAAYNMSELSNSVISQVPAAEEETF